MKIIIMPSFDVVESNREQLLTLRKHMHSIIGQTWTTSMLGVASKAKGNILLHSQEHR